MRKILIKDSDAYTICVDGKDCEIIENRDEAFKKASEYKSQGHTVTIKQNNTTNK